MQTYKLGMRNEVMNSYYHYNSNGSNILKDYNHEGRNYCKALVLVLLLF